MVFSWASCWSEVLNEWQKWEWQRLSIWQKLERRLHGPKYIGDKPTSKWVAVAFYVGYFIIFWTSFFVVFGFLLDGDPAMFEP